MSIDVSTYAHEYKCLWMSEDDADFPEDELQLVCATSPYC